jgi:hypothetical protein
MGRHADALRSQEEALRIRKAALGPDHMDVGTNMNELGIIHKARRQLHSLSRWV